MKNNKLFGKFDTISPAGRPNLNYAIGRYGKSSDREIYEEHICPHIRPEIAVEGYVETNILNLKNLIEWIWKKERKSVRPLLTGPIEEYYREFHDEYAEDDIFWGAWFRYKEAEEKKDKDPRLSLNEVWKLRNILLAPGRGGEDLGYALNLFAGLRITEAANARYGDVFILDDFPNVAALHVRGAFPKFGPAKDYDRLPRFVPLMPTLYKAIRERQQKIEETLTFPVVTEDRTYASVLDLPIACRGDDYTEYSYISDLSASARRVLRDDLGYKEIRLSKFMDNWLRFPERFAAQRSPAYALGSAAFGRDAFYAIRDDDQISYYTGMYEEIGEFDFSDEYHIHRAAMALEDIVERRNP